MKCKSSLILIFSLCSLTYGQSLFEKFPGLPPEFSEPINRVGKFVALVDSCQSDLFSTKGGREKTSVDDCYCEIYLPNTCQEWTRQIAKELFGSYNDESDSPGVEIITLHLYITAPKKGEGSYFFNGECKTLAYGEDVTLDLSPDQSLPYVGLHGEKWTWNRSLLDSCYYQGWKYYLSRRYGEMVELAPGKLEGFIEISTEHVPSEHFEGNVGRLAEFFVESESGIGVWMGLVFVVKD